MRRMTNEDWVKATTRRVAGELKRLRGGRTVQAISDLTAGHGHRISRSRLSDLERGDRGGALGVAELIVLAKALGVPPVVLTFALGRERTVELLPGTEVDAWAAAKWFTGEEPFPGSDEDVEEFPSTYFREQDRLIAIWFRTRDRATVVRTEAGQDPDQPDLERVRQRELDALEERLLAAEKQLRFYRAIARREGVDLGELPPELAHVEQRVTDG